MLGLRLRLAGTTVTPEDRVLLDRVRALHSTLTHRTVLLAHVQSDVDVFAEGLRDLGQDLRDLGDDMLCRVAELDLADAPPHTTLSRESAWCAGELASFGPLVGPK
ncbi:hypothetical protein SAMN05216266_10188 [Amycolatopsis marina]|uniref:Uncharacterized protein n=1 Tax=Amycolatopsis marina TaxID=490629 RepID=A0A1I0V9B5_9PSEU|nr:hypothetical protein [Amycolatopsis marina]SFA72842.1 hypothetical protein SAMN05216266_10188 [Amycolatopsis marina]